MPNHCAPGQGQSEYFPDSRERETERERGLCAQHWGPEMETLETTSCVSCLQQKMAYARKCPQTPNQKKYCARPKKSKQKDPENL